MLNTLRLFRFVWILATASACVLWRPTAGSVPEDIAAQAAVLEAQNKDLQATELGDIPKILDILASNTKFGGHLNVNGKLDPSALNVYVLAPKLKQRDGVPAVFFTANVFGNCAYTGVSNAIICDSDFVFSFLQDHGINGNWSDRSGWTFQDAFLAWILGHELGHAAKGDPAAHFGQENVLTRPTDAAIELSQKLETEADLYAARQIETDKKLATVLENLLIRLMNWEIEKKNGKSAAYGVGLNWDYADKSVVKYFTDQNHPEYVIRATRILTALAADMHEDGLQALLESFSRHLSPKKEKKD